MKALTYSTPIILAILLLSVPIFSQATSPTKRTEAVLRTINELCKAFQTGDTNRLRENMTEDFTLTSSNGSVTTLDDEIGDLKSGRASYSVFKNLNMKVRLYSDTAVVTGQTIIKGVYDGSPVDAEFQFTDTLVWKNERWWMVSSHASRLSAKKP